MRRGAQGPRAVRAARSQPGQGRVDLAAELWRRRVAEGLSVVIPTYDEPGIGHVIRDVQNTIDSRTHEIVIVDDSPTEQTAAQARAAGDDRVRVLRRENSDGLGSAVLRGLDESRYGRVIVMDGDGQHPATAVPTLADALDDVDVAVGSRHVGGRNHAEWGALRTALSFGASALAWLAVPDARPLQDPMSGMFAVRRQVVVAARDRLQPHGFKILLEILGRCPVDGIAEVPIAFHPRRDGKSAFGPREVGNYLRHLGQLAVASRQRSRPDRRQVDVEEVTG
jgi:dolichol-phosphate mannosyltransferase